MQRSAIVIGGALALAVGAAAQAAAQPGPSRALLDRYCVTCHNERLQTANLMLDRVDLERAGDHAEALEKVVRKLRAGQMPPEGRPRPAQEEVETFVAALTTALDDAAAGRLTPGRVASRRLNRVEYVNAIEDLLDLRVDGDELLPSDMAGFGFDNNAEVLAMTPSLMARYIAAATKISQLAVGSPDNRPDGRLYTLGFEQQDERMHEDMPFGTHGGLAARHVFPLDGEYRFSIRMERGLGATSGRVQGHRRGRPRHRAAHRSRAGRALEHRRQVPRPDTRPHHRRRRRQVAADPRVPHDGGPRHGHPPQRRGRPEAGERGVHRFESVARRRGLRTAGDLQPLHRRPLRRHGARRDAEPGADLRLPPGQRRRGRRGGVRTRDPGRAGAAGLPAAGDGARPGRAAAVLRGGPAGARLRARDRTRAGGDPVDAGVPAAGGAAAGRRRRGRAVPPVGPGAGVAPVVLPVAQHPGRRAARRRRAGPPERPGRSRRAGAAHAGRPQGRPLHERLRRPVAAGAQHRRAVARRRPVRAVQRHAPQGDGHGDRAVLPQPGARGPADPRAAARRLHLSERAARAALRHRRRLRQPLPAGRARRRPAPRTAGATPAS